jgi:FkbM family methyltransferase
MRLFQLIKFLVPRSLRRLRWQTRTPGSHANWLMRGGEPEALLLPSLCDRRRVSIDVGGNVGGYTWLLRPLSKRVIVFEANPNLAARLAWLCRLTLKTSVTVDNVALSNRSGTTTLRVPVKDDGRSTIQTSNSLGGWETREVRVPMRRLDDFPAFDIGFMKIDVEGHELAVLQGAETQLRRSQPNLLIEATNEHRPDAVASVWAFLEPLGYAGSFLHDGDWVDVGSFDPATHGAVNFVFRPRSEAVAQA